MFSKRILSFFLFLSLCTLASCRSKPAYLDSFSVDELAESAQRKLTDTQFVQADKDYLDDYITLPESLSEFCVYFSANGNVLDEFGIWRVPTEQTDEVRSLLQKYLSEALTRNRTFYDSYIPKETPKLRDAEVRVYGNYVAYAILGGEERAAFFGKLEERLTKKD